jgi:DNA polymerase III subunit epsilon
MSAADVENDGSLTFIALDFETANEQRDSVCAAGIALVENGKLIEKKAWLVRPPELYFDPFNVAIHGITARDVHDKPEFDVFWESVLREYLDGRIVLAHNAGFDFSVLRKVFTRYSMPFPELTYSCTRLIARKAWPGQMSYALDQLAGRLGITFKHHDAGEDAFACAQVAQAACAHSGAADLHGLAEKLHIVHGRLYAGGYRPPRAKRVYARASRS